MSETSSPVGPHRELDGRVVPTFVYGTAWKEEATRSLVLEALEAGFRGVDTANQRKHYHEAGVGEAIAEAMGEGLVTRDELFLQTKFTYMAGQDHRLPYDPSASPTDQVRQSVESSLVHLGVDHVDSYVLHGPMLRHGLHEADIEVWAAMEDAHADGKTRLLGVSNVGLDQLQELHDRAKVKPSFVQNRCFAEVGWDHAVRAFCKEKGILYQGFSLLTANPQVMSHPALHELAAKYERSLPQLVFRFALQVGMQPLTGTTDPAHMAEDLESYSFELSEEDVALIERMGLRR